MQSGEYFFFTQDGGSRRHKGRGFEHTLPRLPAFLCPVAAHPDVHFPRELYRSQNTRHTGFGVLMRLPVSVSPPVAGFRS